MKETTLTLKERILLSESFPTTGSYLSLILIKSILKLIQVTPEEIKKYKIEEKTAGENSFLSWNDAGNKAKFQYKFDENQHKEIAFALQALDKKKQLNMDLIELYERFTTAK